MTIAEKILLIIACAVLLLVVLWGIGVRNLLRKLRNKARLLYKELCAELDRLYEFSDKVSENIALSSDDAEKISSIKREAKQTKDTEARAECDAILQSRLKNVLEKSGNDKLKAEYADIEMDVISARKKYNAAVREYNCQRKIYPDRIISALFRYKAMGFYTADQIEE